MKTVTWFFDLLLRTIVSIPIALADPKLKSQAWFNFAIVVGLGFISFLLVKKTLRIR